jgi:hypothetical protein
MKEGAALIVEFLAKPLLVTADHKRAMCGMRFLVTGRAPASSTKDFLVFIYVLEDIAQGLC